MLLRPHGDVHKGRDSRGGEGDGASRSPGTRAPLFPARAVTWDAPPPGFEPGTLPPLKSPPPGGETVTSLFSWAISIAVVCVPHLSHTCSCIVFPLLGISHLVCIL